MVRDQRHMAESAVPEVRRPDDLVGDAERRRGVDVVGRAFADGLFDEAQMEHALDTVVQARTVRELDAATQTLPAEWLAAARRSEQAARRAATSRSARRAEIRAYLGVMALLVGIWALTALTAGAGHFWPIWPAMGWGIPLLAGGGGKPAHTRNHHARSPGSHTVA